MVVVTVEWFSLLQRENAWSLIPVEVMGLGMGHAIERVVRHSEDRKPGLRQRRGIKRVRILGCSNNGLRQVCFFFYDGARRFTTRNISPQWRRKSVHKSRPWFSPNLAACLGTRLLAPRRPPLPVFRRHRSKPRTRPDMATLLNFSVLQESK
jgi:hypothetical protein